MLGSLPEVSQTSTYGLTIYHFFQFETASMSFENVHYYM